MRAKYWRTVPHYPMVKEVMQIRFKIVRHPCWSPRKLIKTILKTLRQPQSPVLMYCSSYWLPLLAPALRPESVRLLESQLQVERHRSDVMRQEAEGLRKS